VVSARAGVTDLLLKFASSPGRGGGADALRRRLSARYSGGGPQVLELLGGIDALLSERRRDRAVSAELREELLSLGERLSAQWFTRGLRRIDLPAVAFESGQYGLQVRGHGPRARIDLAGSRAEVRGVVGGAVAKGELPVLTGYFGLAPSGAVRTLGRGSSDYVASAVAALLGARALEFVKRGGPLRTADPEWLPAAPPLERIGYSVARRAASLGWPVLHPRSLEPMARRPIPILIRSVSSVGPASIIAPGRPEPPVALLLRGAGGTGRGGPRGHFLLVGEPPSFLRDRLARSGPPRYVRARPRAGALELRIPQSAPPTAARAWLHRLAHQAGS
jgi:bifunctional aspartokinase / homoserine dehydrogenase 1